MNNPVNFIDPSGNVAIPAGVIVLVTGAGGISIVSYSWLSSPEGQKAINDGAILMGLIMLVEHWVQVIMLV